MKFVDYPVIAVVWTQEGCEACTEFLPKWRAIAERYQSCVPSVAVDCNEHRMAADAYRITETPTVVILRYGRPGWRRIRGAVEPAEIEQLYQYAMLGLDCAL